MRPPISIVPTVCGIYGLLVGLLALAGWAADVPAPTDFMGGGIAMQPNAAVAAALAGAALVLLALGRPRAAGALGVAVAAVGGVTLVENLSGADLGLDRPLLFGRTWGSEGTAAPGRMGIPGSSCFLLLGIGLALAGGGPRRRLRASRVGVAAGALASLPLLGYLLGVQQLHAVSRVSAISPQTVSVLLLLAVGLVAAVREGGLGWILAARGPGGELARRLLPIAVLAPVALTLLALESIRRGIDPGLALAVSVLLVIAVLAGTGLGLAGRVERDAAKLAHAAAERQAAHDRLRLLLENTPLAAIEWDTDLRVVRWSSGAERLFGYREDEVLGRRLSELGLVHEDDVAAVERVSVRLLSGNERYVVSHNRNRTRDRQVRHCEWYNSVLVGPAGRTEAVLSLVLDVTESHEAERALLRSNEEMSRFAYVASHDMREPLRTIITFSALLEKRSADRLDADGRECLQFMAEAARRLNDMILGFLDLSRVSRRDLARTEIDLARAADEVRQSLQVAIDEAAAEVVVAAGTPVHADAILLRQALQNLVENALKFRRSPCRIEIGSRVEDGDTTVWVTDNGIGIPDSEQARVLEVFRRGHGHQYPGAGLGLSTTAKIAERHGGRVWIRSREGEGTTVFMSFPGVARPTPAAAPTTRS